jgi:hypothetical protein
MSDYTYKLTAFSKIILIYPIIAYYFINKEFIGLRLFFPVEEHKILLIAISFFVGVYVLLMKVNNGHLFYIKIEKIWKYFILMLLIWIFSLFFHEIIVGNSGISLKHSFYMSILLLILTKSKVNINSIMKLIIGFSIILVFMGIIQNFIIIIVYDNDLSSFEIWSSVRENFSRDEADYKNPFLLGLLRDTANVSYSSFEFKRVLLYTEEPKYASAWISVMIVVSYIFIKNVKLKYSLVIIFLLSLVAIHSFASFGVLLLSITAFTFRRIIYLFPRIYCALFVVMTPLLHSILYLLKEIVLPTYVQHRIMSGLARAGKNSEIWNIYNAGHSGWLGGMASVYDIANTLIQWSVFLIFSYICVDIARSTRNKFTELMAFFIIYVYFVFWIFVLPEQFTPLLSLLIISTHYLWQSQRLVWGR